MLILLLVSRKEKIDREILYMEIFVILKNPKLQKEENQIISLNLNTIRLGLLEFFMSTHLLICL